MQPQHAATPMTTDSLSPRSTGNLWRRFSANLLGYGYTQAVTLAVQFITVPFFLHHWGNKGYAEWLVLSGVPTLLGLLDLGVGQASGSKAITLAARNQIDGVRCTLQTSLFFTSIVAATLLVIAWFLGHVIDWADLLKLSFLNRSQANTVLLLLCGHLCFTLVGNGPMSGWFRVIDRTSTGIFLLANRRALDVIVTIAILSYGYGPVALAAALLLGQMALMIFHLLLLHRLSPWPVLGLRHASWIEFRSIFKPALGHVGITVGQVVTLQGGLQLLNQIAPPSVVVIYSMGRTLMRLVLQLGVTASHAVRPELSRLVGQGEVSAAKSLHTRISLVVILVSVASYLLLTGIGPWVMEIWSQHRLTTNHMVLAAIGLHALFNVMWYLPLTYKVAVNLHAKTSAIYLAGCILSLCAWPVLAKILPPLYVASIALAIPEFITWVYVGSTRPTKGDH